MVSAKDEPSQVVSQTVTNDVTTQITVTSCVITMITVTSVAVKPSQMMLQVLNFYKNSIKKCSFFRKVRKKSYNS